MGAWSYASGPRSALAHSFSVRASHAGAGETVDRLLAPFVAVEQAATTYSVTEGAAADESRYVLYGGEERLMVSPSLSRLMAGMFWHLNRAVVRSCHAHALLHAAAAEYDGRALLFPGLSGAGKSTLVAGLVGRGMRYFSDEIAAMSLRDLCVQPYPKPLGLKRGSWAVLPALEPPWHDAGDEDPENPWHVVPDAVAPPCGPGLVVFPAFAPGAGTDLCRVRGAEAVGELVQRAFNPHADGVLTALGRVARSVPCYRLRFGELDAACGAVESLIGAA